LKKKFNKHLLVLLLVCCLLQKFETRLKNEKKMKKYILISITWSRLDKSDERGDEHHRHQIHVEDAKVELQLMGQSMEGRTLYTPYRPKRFATTQA
jgi:hypothetical protein